MAWIDAQGDEDAATDAANGAWAAAEAAQAPWSAVDLLGALPDCKHGLQPSVRQREYGIAVCSLAKDVTHATSLPAAAALPDGCGPATVPYRHRPTQTA